jgi:hypothetical protein
MRHGARRKKSSTVTHSKYYDGSRNDAVQLRFAADVAVAPLRARV